MVREGTTTARRVSLRAVTDSQLAVLLRQTLLRQTQWALDEAAYDFPARRATPRRREELARSACGWPPR